jgi:hypothetical protein
MIERLEQDQNQIKRNPKENIQSLIKSNDSKDDELMSKWMANNTDL